MPTRSQDRWAVILFLAFVLMIVTLGCGRTDLDLAMLVVMFIGSIVLMVTSLAITGLIARFYVPFRPHFAPTNLGLLLLLMLTSIGYFCERTTFPGQFERVKAYVVLAVPALNDYASKNGHYPDSLSQLNLTPPIPAGLQYEHIVNPSFDRIPSSEAGPSKDFYSINFKDALLCSNGQWFVDP